MRQIFNRYIVGKPLQVLRAGAVAGALLVANMSGAQADVTPQSVNGFQHFSDCLHALLTDSAEHAQFCAPGIALPSNNSGLSGGGGGQSCDNGPVTLLLVPPGLAFGDRVLVAVNCNQKECSMLTAPAGLAIGDRVLVAGGFPC